jgi:hypothetical protein
MPPPWGPSGDPPKTSSADWRPTASKNEAGERMRSYLIMRKMIAVSTFYKKKPKRHATWWHPNPTFLEQTHSQKNRAFQLST